MPKQEREVAIGKWIKNDFSIYKSIQDGIKEAKRLLCTSNGLELLDIVSIKNDAIFVVGKSLPITTFGNFSFKLKNTYNIYMQLVDLEILYRDEINLNSNSINAIIDVKGISDSMLELHNGGMLDLICDFCYKIQRENIQDIVKWLGNIYQDFIYRKLPKNYYRSFDSFSSFRINTFSRSVMIDDIDDKYINCVDINRNLLIIRDLIFIATDIYNRSIK